MTASRARRAAAAGAALLATALAACPLPQPLPGVTPLDGGTITPPRIQMDGVSPAATVIFYDPAACSPGGAAPGFTLSGSVVDQNVDEVVSVRWFVNYEPATNDALWGLPDSLPAPVDPTQTVRPLTPRVFDPVSYGGAPCSSTQACVVEVVVSNGFAPALPDGGMPNRAPLPGYETQWFRWVFQPQSGAGCGP